MATKKKRTDNKNRVLRPGERQRKDGTYEYRPPAKFNTPKSLYEKDLGVLREKEDAIAKAHFAKHSALPDSDKTINEVFEEWASVKRGIRSTTKSNYIRLFNDYIRNDVGRNQIGSIKKRDFQAFYIRLKDNKGLKISTVSKLHVILHQIVEYAVDNGYLNTNPCNGAIKDLRSETRDEIQQRQALSFQEQHMFTNFLADKASPYHRWYPLFITMLWTGMRVGEVTGLRWCDINFKENYIDVNHTLETQMDKNENGNRCEIHPPKTKSSRRQIPIMPVVEEALRMEREMQKKENIKCKSTIDGYTDFVFLTSSGTTHDRTNLNKVLKRIVKACNSASSLQDMQGEKPVFLPHLSNHILRHTFATRLCEENMNVKAIQSVMGHSSISVTLNVYAEATQMLKKREINTFNQKMLQRCAET